MRSRTFERLFGKLRQVELFDTTGMSAKLRQSLYWVIWGITIGMISNTVTGGAAWTGFQREVLRANDLELGLIAAMPVAANVFQIFFSFHMERRRNRRFALLFYGILGRSLWIVIGLLPFFVPASAHTLRIIATIALVMMVSSGNAFVTLSFWSLMGDLVPMRIRGQYFSVRQRVSLAAGVLAGLLVSGIIDALGATGYSIVLVLAGITGVLDLLSFLFVEWPPMARAQENEKGESPFAMLKSVVKNKRFMDFCIIFTCWQFAVSLSGPFNNVYLIEVMRLSFVEITLFSQIVSNLTTVFSVTLWGRLIDRYGNKPVMRFVGAVCMLLTVLWVFMKPGDIWLVVLYHFINGLFWISMDMGQQNLSLSLSPQQNRSVYVAVYFAMINLLGNALGNVLGGVLVQGPFTALAASGAVTLFGVVLNRYHYIFLLGAVLRTLVMLVLIPRIEEEGARSVHTMLHSQYTGLQAKIRLWRRAVIIKRIRLRVRRQNNTESE